MKKYVGNMKIRTLPIYRPWDLEKFRDRPLISGREVGVGGRVGKNRRRSDQLLGVERSSVDTTGEIESVGKIGVSG